MKPAMPCRPAVLPPLLALLAAGPVAAGAAEAATRPGDAEVVFGMTAPFTGPSKEYGRQLRTGVELAFAAANEAGGVAGRKLRLVAMDDGDEPARTATAVRDLVEHRKVFGLVGLFGSAGAAAVLPYLIQQHVLLFGAYSGSALLRNDPPDRYVFNFRPSYTEEMAAVVKYLVEVRRIRPAQIAVFLQDDPVGEAGWNGVARVMRRYHRDPHQVIRATYKRNSVDVDEAFRVIQKNASRLRAVAMVADYKPATRLIEKLRSAELDLMVTNLSAVGPSELADELRQLGPGFARGVVVTQVVPPPTSQATAILRYQDLLRRLAPESAPDYTSLEGYIVGSLLVEGLRRAGRKLDVETLVDALEGIKDLDMGIGISLGFGPSEHQASHKVWGTLLQADGSYRPIDLE